MHLTRRHALASAGVLAVAACTSSNEQGGPRQVDPDIALHDAAVERERALLAVYRDAMTAAPSLASKLAPLLADHESHLAVLGGVTGAPSSSSAPSVARTPAAVLAQLRLAERTAATAHAAGALTASRELAATLASLAACEASHGVVL